MSEEYAGKMTKIWLISAICGVLAFLALLLLASYSTGASLIVGVLVAVLVAILLWIGWYDDEASAKKEAGGHPSAAATREGVMHTTGVGDEPASAAGEFDDERPTPPVATTTAQTAAPAAGLMATGAVTTAEDTGATDTETAAETPAAKKPAAKKPAAKKTTAKAAPAKTAAKAAPKGTAPQTATRAKAAAPKRAPVAADGTPDNLLTAPRAEGADDLKQIKGVGPKLEGTLNALGIYHFDQIAALRKKEREWLDDRLKFKGRIDRDDWVGQAKTLAKGGQTEFSQRVKKGGVY